ncbi:MAG: hypothetical protein ACYCWW_09835, partial [Deltaproteobacteria bacterium]
MIRNRVVLGMAASLLLAGCCRQHSGGGGGGGLIALDGVPTLAPSPLDFGTVGTGTTHQKGLTITNHGSGPLTLKSISIAGDPSFSAA